MVIARKSFSRKRAFCLHFQDFLNLVFEWSATYCGHFYAIRIQFDTFEWFNLYIFIKTKLKDIHESILIICA